MTKFEYWKFPTGSLMIKKSEDGIAIETETVEQDSEKGKEILKKLDGKDYSYELLGVEETFREIEKEEEKLNMKEKYGEQENTVSLDDPLTFAENKVASLKSLERKEILSVGLIYKLMANLNEDSTREEIAESLKKVADYATHAASLIEA